MRIFYFVAMKTRHVNLRLDERTHMQLNEIADRLGVKLSSVIRTVLREGIDRITDEKGNIQLNEK